MVTAVSTCMNLNLKTLPHESLQLCRWEATHSSHDPAHSVEPRLGGVMLQPHKIEPFGATEFSVWGSNSGMTRMWTRKNIYCRWSNSGYTRITQYNNPIYPTFLTLCDAAIQKDAGERRRGPGGRKGRWPIGGGQAWSQTPQKGPAKTKLIWSE